MNMNEGQSRNWQHIKLLDKCCILSVLYFNSIFGCSFMHLVLQSIIIISCLTFAKFLEGIFGALLFKKFFFWGGGILSVTKYF